MGIVSRVGMWAFFCGILLLAGSVSAADNSDVPKDTCILKLTLPEKATVSVDGRDYGTKRKLTFRGLKPETTYASKMSVQPANGRLQECKLLIHGGWRTRYVPPPKHAFSPDLLVQTSRYWDTDYAVSPDKRLLAITDYSGIASVWDISSGCRLRTYTLPKGRPWAVAFAPNGKQLVTVSAYSSGKSAADSKGVPNEIIFWDVETGNRIRSWQRSLGLPTAAGLTPDSQYLVTCHRNPHLTVVWEAVSGRPVKTIDHGKQPPNAVCFHPDGGHFAIGVGDRRSGSVLVGISKTGEVLKTLDYGEEVECLTLSPDGRYLAAVRKQPLSFIIEV